MRWRAHRAWYSGGSIHQSSIYVSLEACDQRQSSRIHSTTDVYATGTLAFTNDRHVGAWHRTSEFRGDNAWKLLSSPRHSIAGCSDLRSQEIYHEAVRRSKGDSATPQIPILCAHGVTDADIDRCFRLLYLLQPIPGLFFHIFAKWYRSLSKRKGCYVESLSVKYVGRSRFVFIGAYLKTLSHTSASIGQVIIWLGGSIVCL